MAVKQTFKKIIKLTLQLINFSLFAALIWLVAYGYYTVQPAIEQKAISDMQKIVINIHKQHQELPFDKNSSHEREEEDKAPSTLDEAQLEADKAAINPGSQANEAKEKKNLIEIEPKITADNKADNEVEDEQLSEATNNNQSSNADHTQNTQGADNTKDQINISDSSNPYKVQKTKIAILLTNLGLGKNVTEAAIQLPNEIALGISPYTNSLKEALYKAKENGHELFLEIPFETEKYPLDDMGPLGILLLSDDGENLSRLQQILTAFPGINGVYSLPNEKFTDNVQRIDPILDIISRNRLLLLYGKGYSNMLLFQLVTQKRISTLACDHYIDLNTELSLIQKNLEKLEEISKSKGKALGYINSYPITISALADWLKTLDNKNIELVPVSEILGQ
ncbi:MAG: divergent polysaccharide deacetylase family protein [Rickettsiaceae bacterium]|jgi:polysaccharide deacetylase 2 family uncharacterized protein YibQ|nr:divergent polysaccharide deacetylase family protein [Rickettsiaceae bacterium]